MASILPARYLRVSISIQRCRQTAKAITWQMATIPELRMSDITFNNEPSTINPDMVLPGMSILGLMNTRLQRKQK
jgi:hypothetical protein